MFKEPSTMGKNRIYLLLEGPQDSRKTTLAIQAPGPTGIININRGLDIPEFHAEVSKGKKLYVSDIPMPRGTEEDRQKIAQESWETIYTDFCQSVEEYEWTFLDTGSNAWEICRLAKMGALTVHDITGEHADKLKRRGQLNFDAPNTAMRGMLSYPNEVGANVIIASHQTEWEGIIKSRGFKETPEIVLQHVVLDKDFSCRIVRCKNNQSCVGKTLQCPSFTDLACTFYPMSDPEDWL